MGAEDDLRWKKTFDGRFPLMCSSSIFPARAIDHSVLFFWPALYMLLESKMIFHKDPCTDARTLGVSVYARVSSRQNARTYVYVSCAGICARIFMKNHLMILYYLMNISLKFHKDLSFCCGNICKTILTFKNHKFFNVFCIFPQFCTSKVFKNG